MSEAAAAPGLSSLLSDERLTRRAVGGDDRAFAAIFRRYHQPLYRFCLAIVGNPEDAQDALQNTMVKVLRALPGEERRIDLKPWLYRIAHNESIDLLRRRRETSQLDVEQVAPGYGLAEDAATRERLRRLVADLRELPERQREVLVMREMSGLDFEEIALAVASSPAVARQTLYEARQSLRQMEEGREMSCETVGMALSEGDGRVTRRRDVRAHLRSCARCRDFRDEIKSRERDFAALAPLPAVAAAGMLQGLLGGSQAAGGGAGSGLAATLGGGAAKTIATSAAVKGVATVAVVAAVGVTAADRSGVIHLGLPGEQSQKSAPATPGTGGGAATDRAGGGKDGARAPADRAADSGHEKGAAAVKAASGPQNSAAAVAGKEHGQAHHEAGSHAGSKAQGPPAEVEAGGGEHEKAHPEASGGGQETAAEHKLENEESAGSADPGEGQSENEDGDTESAPAAEKPAIHEPPAAKPPPTKGGSENPPKEAAPEAPPPANPSKPVTKTEQPPAPPAAGSEKG
ncbi:MAG TPA: sigma-70 family RNA polymerase sigma factor [Solirubrobacterales bacterium]|nr:sigma-70 family RNA polymerase sigma factor [Solirubrobacterales bacterium]